LGKLKPFRLHSIQLSCLNSAMVTLFHVSDLHFGQEDRAALDWFAGEVTREKPDAVICTGDLTMRARVREFAAAAEWLGALGVPVSVEPGNHDIPYYWEPITRVRRTFERYQELRQAVHRDLEVDGAALVSLQTIASAQWRLNLPWLRQLRGWRRLVLPDCG
jgi:3',5'-cyclic AMP phosphodiesterase CpdA